MTRSSGYSTNGSSALALQCNGFTVYEGGLNRMPSSNHDELQAQKLTLAQSLKAFMAIALLLCALGATLVYSNAAAQAMFEASFSNVPTTTVTVHTGDSLWDIAQDHTPQGCSTSSVVRWITQHNNLDSSLIVSGQKLVVPEP